MSRRNLIWMVVILCLAGLALVLARRRTPRVEPTDPAVEQLAPAVRAFQRIQQRAYRPLSPPEACRGAIEGMVRQVDPHSTYVPPEQSEQIDQRLSGRVRETGLRIERKGDRLVTIGSLPGSPADEAGIGPGEEVLAIDETEARYLTLAEARELLERPEGDTVVVRLRARGGEEAARELKPATFAVPTVVGLARDEQGRWTYALDERSGLYYIRVREFAPQRTVSEFHEVFRDLDQPAGLVLDLRGNPGGYLQPAATLCDRFLDAGVIVRIVGRRGQPHVHRAHADGTYPPVELAVLIDGRTASAAEIVAGALQVHRRAVLVGQPTYGKWYVQSPVPLEDGMGTMYLTTAEYFLAEPAPETRPAGTGTTQLAPGASSVPTAPAALGRRREGVQPDVPVRLAARAAEQLELLRLRTLVAPPREPLLPAGPRRMPLHLRTRRALLRLDEQLAVAASVLKERLAPPTRPVGTMARAGGGRGPGP